MRDNPLYYFDETPLKAVNLMTRGEVRESSKRAPKEEGGDDGSRETRKQGRDNERRCTRCEEGKRDCRAREVGDCARLKDVPSRSQKFGNQGV